MTNPPPLEGIRVLEMTEALSGPYCAMMLGDLGADVIKIERKDVGDQSRKWGPPFVEGESAYFMSVNRNKRSITLDIKEADDLSVLHQLITRSDVFITNNPRLESLQRYQLDPDYARNLNPRLIYVGISGYGHTGPKANRGGYDVIAQGEAGLMALTGEPGEGPKRFPTPIADITAGLYAVMGIISSLYARDNSRNGSGMGEFIDVSLVDAQLTWLANLGGSYLIGGQEPQKLGNQHPTITPYQPLRAKDQHIMVAVGTEAAWARFCQALGVESTIGNDPRFATNVERNANRELLLSQLEAILMTQPRAYWIERFVAYQVAAGPINFPPDILADEQTLARRMVVELEHPLIGMIKNIGNPIHFSNTSPVYWRHPPLLGEHSQEIRRALADEVNSGA